MRRGLAGRHSIWRLERAGKFRGGQENVAKNEAIARASWSGIQAMTGCGRATVARVVRKQREAS
jgi:hypothetical protein